MLHFDRDRCESSHPYFKRFITYIVALCLTFPVMKRHTVQALASLSLSPSTDHTAESSPKLASYTCEFTDESGEINIPVPQPVCINGSHVYNTILDPCPGNPVVPLDPLALVKKNLPLSQSLQNLSQRREELPVLLPKGPAADGRRWSFDKAGEEEKVVIAAALEQAGQGMGEGAREESDRDSQGRKRSRDCLDESEQASNSDSGPGEKHKGWFGSKDNHNKPR